MRIDRSSNIIYNGATSWGGKSMKPMDITKHNFNEEIINSDKPVLIEFYATWCPTCRLFSPVMNQLAGEMSDIKITAVNIEHEKELPERYGIKSIPTVLFIKDGKVIESRFGYQRKEEMLKLLKG